MKKKNVAIICFLDGFANSVRPKETKKFLEKRGLNVELINTSNIYSLNKNSFSYITQLQLYLLSLQCKIVGVISLLLDIHDNGISKSLRATVLIQQMKLRGKYLSIYINSKKFNVLICNSSFDSYVVTQKFEGITIYDSPSPWGYELYYSGKFSEGGFKRFQTFEKSIYKKADYLSFQWDSYTKFVKKYFYNGTNLFTMNYGVYAKSKRFHAKFKKPLKIIFMGYLGGSWVNLPLLSKLSSIYPIDVYGGPKPDYKWKLNYKGYAPTTDVLKEYQLSLITITDDLLRKHSFSSKQLDYLAYGLPVLSPEWRTDSRLDDVSIKYNIKNFLQKIKYYENEARWIKMQHKGFDKINEYSWEKALKPLEKIIESSK